MEKISRENNTADTPLSDNGLNEPPDQDEAPLIKLLDEELWKFYGNASDDEIIDTMVAAEKWAITMQEELPSDPSPKVIHSLIETIWLESFINSTDEFTEHGLDKAVAILARCWQYGDSLRQVHSEYKKEKIESSDDSFYDQGVL